MDVYGEEEEEEEEEEDVFDFIVVVFVVIINGIVCGCECVLSSLSLFSLFYVCVCV